MALAPSQQAVFDYLVAGPGVQHRVSPPDQRGWVAFTSSGGGADADPGTVEFRKTRGFGDCELHYAAFRTTGGQEQWLLSRTWRRPGGDWAAGPIGGGGGGHPARRRPWVNFAAMWGDALFAGGGEVTGDGCEQAHLVRLTFADGTAVQDGADQGVVLFFVPRAVTFPASVQILGRDGTVLAAYEEFAEFAD
ncbi:MAG TPA: hypothetical protein VGI05_18980 [Streptosporangiaceae bacterium]|jgi:hypothetical protein